MFLEPAEPKTDLGDKNSPCLNWQSLMLLALFAPFPSPGNYRL